MKTWRLFLLPVLCIAHLIDSDGIGDLEHRKLHRHAEAIPGQYVVGLVDEIENVQETMEALIGDLAVIDEVYESGKAAAISEVHSREFLELLLEQDEVEFVEENHVMALQEEPVVVVDLYSNQNGTAAMEMEDSAGGWSNRQRHALKKKKKQKKKRASIKGQQSSVLGNGLEVWGLDRTDQYRLPLNQSYRWRRTGFGVDAYVIDTGILTTHSEFDGRATCGFDWYDTGCRDGNGHGTHCSGTIGGQNVGMAKRVQLIGVKVLDSSGSGTLFGIIAGVNYVNSQAKSTGRPSVANMSLGAAGTSPALEQAVFRAIQSGVTFSLAAGNENVNACLVTPARVKAGITVAASDRYDERASFSNWGAQCVDIFAPGVSILSAWASSNTAGAYLSGTSMAAPHVAGAVALFLQREPSATPSRVRNFLVYQSGKNMLKFVRYTPNRLLNVARI